MRRSGRPGRPRCPVRWPPWSRRRGGWTAPSETSSSQIEGEYRRREQDVGRVRRRLPPLLLAGRLAGRPEAGPVPPAGHRGARPHRQGPRLAHGDAGRGLPAPIPEILLATPYLVVDVTDPASQAAGIAWWEELTGRGGEGMVVKPLSFIHRGSRGLAQPAVKCRGREYLRIIYGPEYTTERTSPGCGLGAWAGSGRSPSASSPWASKALERFVRREPLRRVHECVFGVLALESEPVDPRL